MNSNDTKKCDQCGAHIPASSTEQLCPACLLEKAFQHNPTDSAPGAEKSRLLLMGSNLTFPIKFGHYRLLDLLGRGGMGVVYKAEHLESGRLVALKMLGNQIESTEMQQRFLREGRMAARTNHPNSLYIFGSEEIEGLPVISMEIADRGTLADKLEKDGPLATVEAVDAILDMISGLESALKNGVLHRDIKPSNCFINHDDSVKVGDFGLSISTLARDDSFLTSGGMVLGTPAFASPEQLRGDEIDVRSDIYAVGATLYTLLTNCPPFQGKNAVQIVAKVLNEKAEIHDNHNAIPNELLKVISRCLCKNPRERFPDYQSLRKALLPFSSKEPEPASILVRSAAGWIDYLIAFLLPYIPLMLAIGNDAFHVGPFLQKTPQSFWQFYVLYGFATLYFTIAEGMWGAGLGKHLKGLKIIRMNGKPAGFLRAFIKIFMQILCIEGVRIPLLLHTISATRIQDMTSQEVVIFSVATALCPLLPVAGIFAAQRHNGYRTLWDILSGTRVIINPQQTDRIIFKNADEPTSTTTHNAMGPFMITKEISPQEWLIGTDALLRREVWLIKRSGEKISAARRNISRLTRLRWLQEIEYDHSTWDVYQAPDGQSFLKIISDDKISWAHMRLWLFDIASELWADRNTLPDRLSFSHIWITTDGHAIILDKAWPTSTKSTEFSIKDDAGRQTFLNALAECIDKTTVPLHARPVLDNLANGSFAKLSFLTGTLQSLLDKPAEVNRGIRIASLFVLPLYIWIMFFLGTWQSTNWLNNLIGSSLFAHAVATAYFILACIAIIQIFEIPFKTTASLEIFRLAIINHNGTRANAVTLLRRWAIIWLPLLSLLFITTLSIPLFLNIAAVGILIWLAAACFAVIHPVRGLPEILSGTWIVRQ